MGLWANHCPDSQDQVGMPRTPDPQALSQGEVGLSLQASSLCFSGTCHLIPAPGPLSRLYSLLGCLSPSSWPPKPVLPKGLSRTTDHKVLHRK